MKKSFVKLAAVLLAASMGVSCSTTYDQNGRARSQVNPGGALLGAAAVGLVGYTVAKNRYKDDDHRGYHDNYYRGRDYRNQGYRDFRNNGYGYGGQSCPPSRDRY